jgi:predicted outer membrane repeat protein
MNRSFGFFGTCPGPTIIDGQSLNQLFYANTNNLTVTMQLLTLQNSTATSGGAVWADFNANLTFNGTQVYFYKNFSTGGGGGGGALDWDTVNCTDCVFDSNQATNYGSAIQASNINLQRTLFINNTSGGHTIWIGTGGTSSIVNSTFYNNTGGGVYFNGPGTYSFLNDTFVDNSTTIAFDVGAIEGGGGSSFTVTNTLLYNNTGPWGACEGTLVDGGGNEVFPAVSGCTFIQASDIYVAPSLGSLQNNGGYSDTLATLPGSSGIDEALSGSCPTFDQRNYPRLTDGKCDIGAYESEP